VATSKDGRAVFVLGAGTELRSSDVASGEARAPLQKAGTLRAFAGSPDGKLIAASRALPGEPDAWHVPKLRRAESPKEMLGLWNAGTGKLVRILEGQKPPVTALAFSPDSTRLASGGFLSDDVWLWNVADGEPVLLIPEAAGGCAVEALAWHPNGKHLAVSGIDHLSTGGTDGKTGVWNVEGRHPIHWIPGGGVALAFHPRGHHLAIASLVQTVRVWDISEKESRRALELVGHLDAVTCVAYSPDGLLLATGSDDHSVRLWDAATGLPRGVADLDTQVKALCFSPDGKSLFTGNANTSCYQLDVARIV
jgi:WD40 repeat protein